jgi:hypothetical protein
MIALMQIEDRMDQYESRIIDLYEGIQEAAEIVDLILAGGDSPRSKSRRLRILRKSVIRSKETIALFDCALANLEAERRRWLTAEHVD